MSDVPLVSFWDGLSDCVWDFSRLLERALQGMLRQRGQSSKAMWTVDAEQRRAETAEEVPQNWKCFFDAFNAHGLQDRFPTMVRGYCRKCSKDVRKSPELSGWSDLQPYQSPRVPTSIHWIVPFVNLM